MIRPEFEMDIDSWFVRPSCGVVVRGTACGASASGPLRLCKWHRSQRRRASPSDFQKKYRWIDLEPGPVSVCFVDIKVS